MVGFETSDDAAVYRLDDDTALLLTVDFFTPIVDDPYDFGRITAANALSDIYAMGGRPLTAMNLVAFPCSLGPEVVAEVLRGGGDVCREAGAIVVGGHTIDDKEPKFGLSVLGIVDPDRVVRNVGARPATCSCSRSRSAPASSAPRSSAGSRTRTTRARRSSSRWRRSTAPPARRCRRSASTPPPT